MPVAIGSAVDVTFILAVAFSAIVGAVAVGPAILSWLCCCSCASKSLAASTSASTSLVSIVASLVFVVASLVSIAASACVVAVAVTVAAAAAAAVSVAVAVAVAVVAAVTVTVAVAVAVAVVAVVGGGDLGLKVGDSCHEMLHLFYHAVLLGCVRHFLLLELMLHLFGAQTFDYLVDDGGSIHLVVIAEGICCDSRLTTLNVALGFLEMRRLECWPGFFREKQNLYKSCIAIY